MSPRGIIGKLGRALRAVSVRRMAVLLVAAVAAGLGTDWLRGDGRLIFPRPLPVFTTTPPGR